MPPLPLPFPPPMPLPLPSPLSRATQAGSWSARASCSRACPCWPAAAQLQLPVYSIRSRLLKARGGTAPPMGMVNTEEEEGKLPAGGRSAGAGAQAALCCAAATPPWGTSPSGVVGRAGVLARPAELSARICARPGSAESKRACAHSRSACSARAASGTLEASRAAWASSRCPHAKVKQTSAPTPCWASRPGAGAGPQGPVMPDGRVRWLAPGPSCWDGAGGAGWV